MNIGILGAGRIGGALGKQWVQAGHTVHFGVRDPQKPEVQALVNSLGEQAAAATAAEAIDFGEVILFAIPAKAVLEIVLRNTAALSKKIILDPTNKFDGGTMNSFETFTMHAPKARVYRAFNHYGSAVLENPRFQGEAADLYYCGPNGEPRLVVEQIILDAGLTPIYVGGPDQVTTVDALGRLWLALSKDPKVSSERAFKTLTR
jgi:predicted dinucleotide-binding enzyme